MSKRFGTDRTQEEINEIIKQMEINGYTYSSFRDKKMFIDNVTEQRLSMKGAVSYLRSHGIEIGDFL
tara:strand:- start:1046 stop:1246 length:201 start_codon:yes stop_codon:yes gene_type:complete